jgi:hypothetical protein
MTSNEVVHVLTQAIARAEHIMPNAVIAVADREGYILGVWTMDSDTTNSIAQLNILDAITKAGTASYLSSDEHAFTSRTAGFIVQQNFPPRIRNRGTGPLVGVNFRAQPIVHRERNQWRCRAWPGSDQRVGRIARRCALVPRW